jgi:Tol biopolymer transport system component
VDVVINASGVPEGRNARQLSGSCGVNLGTFVECEPAWSPGGAEIALTIRGDLWVIPAGGGTATLLYSAWGVGSPTWSPDGNRLAVAESTTIITVLDVTRDGSGSVTGASVSRKVRLAAGFVWLADLDWSRTNANILAFSGLPVANGSRRTVYTLDVAQSVPTPVRIGEGEDPTWSHDDTKLAFILGTQQKLTVLDLASGQSVTLTADALDPDWTRRVPR